MSKLVVICKFWLFLILLLIPMTNHVTIGLDNTTCRQYRGNHGVMDSFLQVCEDTKEKLGRQLQDNEVEFLQWMYERYKEEQCEILFSGRP